MSIDTPQTAIMKLKEVERQLPNAMIKTIKGATMWGERWAKTLAPVKYGALKRGIKRRPVIKQGNVVSSSLVSTVPKRFPYHFWVNEEEGYTRIRLARRPVFRDKWPTRETRASDKAKWVKSFTYRQTKHTGVPRYFDVATQMVMAKFPQLARQELKRTLKVIYRKKK